MHQLFKALDETAAYMSTKPSADRMKGELAGRHQAVDRVLAAAEELRKIQGNIIAPFFQHEQTRAILALIQAVDAMNPSEKH
jgi:hypothetical protein